MNLLTVIPFCAADWERAEHLLDWIFQQNKRVPFGHCLLSAAGDTHAEMRLRVKISAELAFRHVTEFLAAKEVQMPPQIHLFRETALFVGRNTRWPWLLLEPDAVPLVPNWLASLAAEYDNQPFRYMGNHLKSASGPLLDRVAIYPASAVNDFDTKREFISMSSKSRRIQFGRFVEGDQGKLLREDAVLFHGCKDGSLIKLLRAREPDGAAPIFGAPADFRQVNLASH